MAGQRKESWAWSPEDGLGMEVFSAAGIGEEKLEEKRDELEDGARKVLCMNQLEKAESQMKSISEWYKQREKDGQDDHGASALNITPLHH